MFKHMCARHGYPLHLCTVCRPDLTSRAEVLADIALRAQRHEMRQRLFASVGPFGMLKDRHEFGHGGIVGRAAEAIPAGAAMELRIQDDGSGLAYLMRRDESREPVAEVLAMGPDEGLLGEISRWTP